MQVPVSVIIPCYRCATTIPRALESVAKQTMLPAEVLLIDDGSGDQTIETLRALAERYKDVLKIEIISLPENQGPSVARNAGWERAKQPFIAFLDADDTWDAKKLEIQYQWMQAHPEISLSGHLTVSLRPGQVATACPDKWQARPVTTWALLLRNRLPTRSVMLRRDIRYRFDPTKRYTEDYLLWLRVIFGNYAIAFLDLPLAYSYKPDLGDAGLTSRLWKMEAGELDAYRQLRRSGAISIFTTVALMAWSLARYLRRVLLVSIGRLRRRIA